MVDTIRKPFAAYTGDEPYFFVCYSHSNAQEVYAELRRLNTMGAHLWYDEGITPGSEWSEHLARAIRNARAVLLFVSRASIESKHCRDEIGYAKDRNIPIISIYLEAAALTEGLKLSLGTSQAIMKYELTDTQYQQKLAQLLINDDEAGDNRQTASPPAPAIRQRLPGSRWWIITAAVIAVVLLAAGFLYTTRQPAPASTAPASLARKSIAVLPFVNLSNDPENEFFADGLTDTMIYRLSQMKDLQVTARTSVFAFKRSSEDVRSIAAKLGVNTVLDGSVQRHGDQIRVFAQLTDIASNDNVWSDQFDMTIQDTFVIQDQIAASVTSALKLKLLGSVARSLTSHPTDNLEAYSLYLRGVQFYEQFNFESLNKSAVLLEQAIELDPDFSIAYLALVRNYTTQNIAGAIDLDDMNRRVKPLLTRAAQLDEDLGEEYALRGLVASLSGNPKEGRRTLARAIELNPNSAIAISQLGGLLAFSDEPQRGMEMATAARALDPLGQWPRFDFWFAAQRLGEFDQAWTAIEAGAQSWDLFFQSLQLYLVSGAYEEAADAFIRGMQTDSLDPEFPAYVALISLDIGAQEQAQEYVSKTLAADPEHKMGNLAAALYALDTGHVEEARAIAAAALASAKPLRFESAFLLPRILRDRYLDEGTPERAIEFYYDLFPRLHELDLEGTYPLLMPTALVHVALDLSMVLDQTGRHEQAEKLRGSAADMLEQLPPEGLFGYALAKAELLALEGDKNGALAEMEKTLARGWGQLWKFHTRYNRNFDSIKDDQRYQTMLSNLETRMIPARR